MWGQPDELVECYTDSDCLSATTPLLMTRRECCVDTPGDTGFRTVGSETCNITFCVGTYNIIAYIHALIQLPQIWSMSIKLVLQNSFRS